jgi:GntR family transcriptional regulator
MVDPAAPMWKREQAANELRRMITEGEIGPRLPSQMELAQRLGVSPMTVQRALAILKDEGLVRSVPGLGTFVRGD